MYVAAGQGQTTPWGHMLMSTESRYHFAHLLQVLKQSLHVFSCFPHVYSPGQGHTTHWGQNFDDNRKAFSLCPYVASFKMISSKSNFIHNFNDFIHAYSPGARAYYPLGINFYVDRKTISPGPFVASLKKEI